MKSKETIIKNTVIISLVVLTIITTFIIVKGWINGHFNSIDTFRTYIASYGIWAPLILILVQALLAVLPVFPSFIGCIAGAALFGATGGFFTNYIGICVGSIAAYALAKQYGVRLVNKMLPMEKYNAYIDKINRSKNYPRFLFLAISLPIAPDNFLCYFSGLINMPTRKFVTIIILGKPWCILFYSIFFAYFL